MLRHHSTLGTLVLILASGLVLADAAAQQQPPRAIHLKGKALVGPHCVPGYVWREAFSGDVVCVISSRRDAVRDEDSTGPSRVQPGGGPYGPDTCSAGYVWREARPDDHVCVTPDSREIVARENARAAQLVSRCGTPENCAREAREKQARVDELRRRLAQRQRDLAKAKEDQRNLMEQLRREDEAWARAHPGLGRSTQPSIADNISPIEQDIRAIETALKNAEIDAAKSQGQAKR